MEKPDGGTRLRRVENMTDQKIHRYLVYGVNNQTCEPWEKPVLAYTAEDALTQARCDCALVMNHKNEPICAVLGVKPCPAGADS